jgi:polysaccharide biosynthesis PFTS motif protein
MQSERGVTLIYHLSNNQIFNSGSTFGLQEFIRGKKVGLATNDLIYVERSRIFPNRIDQDDIRVVSDIDLYLFIDFLSVRDRLNVLHDVLLRLLAYVRTIPKLPIFSLIAVPFVIEEVIFSYISKNELIRSNNIVTTPSSIMNKEFIFQISRNFGSRIMIWYSANSIPINYRYPKSNRALSDQNLYSFLPIDQHFVWTEDHRNYLKSQLPHYVNLKVCGSLMFYQPQKKYNLNKIRELMIFDVVPYNDLKTSYNSIYPDSFNSIFNFTYAKSFLDDILWVREEIFSKSNILLKISLKSKREFTSAHNITYINYIKLLSKNKLLDVINPNVDIFEIISQSKMCISFPFTSPAIIATELGVPSIYYLENDIMDFYQEMHGVPFVEKKELLLKFIKEFALEK